MKTEKVIAESPLSSTVVVDHVKEIATNVIALQKQCRGRFKQDLMDIASFLVKIAKLLAEKHEPNLQPTDRRIILARDAIQKIKKQAISIHLSDLIPSENPREKPRKSTSLNGLIEPPKKEPTKAYIQDPNSPLLVYQKAVDSPATNASELSSSTRRKGRTLLFQEVMKKF